MKVKIVDVTRLLCKVSGVGYENNWITDFIVLYYESVKNWETTLYVVYEGGSSIVIKSNGSVELFYFE